MLLLFEGIGSCVLVTDDLEMQTRFLGTQWNARKIYGARTGH